MAAAVISRSVTAGGTPNVEWAIRATQEVIVSASACVATLRLASSWATCCR